MKKKCEEVNLKFSLALYGLFVLSIASNYTGNLQLNVASELPRSFMPWTGLPPNIRTPVV